MRLCTNAPNAVLQCIKCTHTPVHPCTAASTHRHIKCTYIPLHSRTDAPTYFKHGSTKCTYMMQQTHLHLSASVHQCTNAALRCTKPTYTPVHPCLVAPNALTQSINYTYIPVYPCTDASNALTSQCIHALMYSKHGRTKCTYTLAYPYPDAPNAAL